MFMKNLTARQSEVLSYIKIFLENKSYWPSFRDIQAHFNFKSTNAVMGHLKSLEKKGYIERIPGQARSFHLTEKNSTRKQKKTSPIPSEQVETAFLPVVDVPIYGNIAAGYPDRVESSGEIARLQIDSETAGINRIQKVFALIVRGDSMIDAGIYDGDTVILETGEPRNGDIVAALIDGETTLKRYIHQDGTPYLKAENVNYPLLEPTESLSIQGIAKSIVRKL